jgi:hypothetical protein
MRGRLLKQVAVVILLCGSLATQIKGPERKVEGNVITSEREPKIRIRIPKSVQYVGAVRWALYGIADCELHAFVEADGQKNVERLYWIQFEGYLPTKPELKHTYDSPRHAQIGGLDFYVDTWVRPNDATTEQRSDREHIEPLIHGKGYKMPAGMMCVRLVHLLDDRKRKELMIIYDEDRSDTGYTAAELRGGGKAYSRWPTIEEELVARAEKKIMIEESAHP